MIGWWQILLLTLYSAYQICDELTINSSAGSPVFAGFISGLIMGDMTTGLWIGGSFNGLHGRPWSFLNNLLCTLY